MTHIGGEILPFPTITWNDRNGATLRPFRTQSDLGVPGRNPNSIFCSRHPTANGRISTASVISACSRP